MIDLRAIAGDRYRVAIPDWAKGQPKAERPWLWQIDGKYGHVTVHTATRLSAFTGSSRVATRLAAIDGTELHQAGDTEHTFTFPPESFPAVAELLKLRRRRVMTDAQRQSAVERLRPFNFSTHKNDS